MSKKSNLMFISLVTVFALVIAYFAVLSPTTAYYYKSEEKSVNVNFSLLDVTQTVSEIAADVNLKASTKFFDFSEILFDDVCYEQTVTLTNSGDIDAKIYVQVDVPDEDTTNGLRYFIAKSDIIAPEEETSQEILEETTTSGVTSPAITLQKGLIKTEIENSLSSFDESFVDGISFTDADAILEAYNEQYVSFDDAPLLKKGETVTVKIYFWAEYDAISSELYSNGIVSFEYAPVVNVYAAQNTSEAAPSTSASQQVV